MRKITKALLGTMLAMSLSIVPVSVNAEVEGPEYMLIPKGLTDEEKFAACPEGYEPVGFYVVNILTGEDKTYYFYYKKIDETAKDNEVEENPEFPSVPGYYVPDEIFDHMEDYYDAEFELWVLLNKPEPNFMDYEPGDLDFDGKVTLKDAKRNLQLAMGIDEENSILEHIAADIDKDKKITLQDTSKNLKSALNIPIDSDAGIEDGAAMYTWGIVVSNDNHVLGVKTSNIPEDGNVEGLEPDCYLLLDGVKLTKNYEAITSEELTVGTEILYECKHLQTDENGYKTNCDSIEVVVDGVVR